MLALAVLPFIQLLLLLGYARLRRIPVSARWLLALSTLALLTHPTLDWLNNYGMRWLMPFRGTWSYGDSVFIIDLWLWLILGSGWLLARRWKKAAIIALSVASLYIGNRLVIHQATVMTVQGELHPDRLMASPDALDPLRWDIVAQIGDVYRHGSYSWRTRRLTLAGDEIPVAKPSPEWEAAKRDPSMRGFMTWVRFPWYEIERTPAETRVFVGDARYVTRSNRRGFGQRTVILPR